MEEKNKEFKELLKSTKIWGIVPKNPRGGLLINGRTELPKEPLDFNVLRILAAGISFYGDGIMRDSKIVLDTGFHGHYDLAACLSELGYAGSLLFQSSNVPTSGRIIRSGLVDVVIYGDDSGNEVGTIENAIEIYKQKTGRRPYHITSLSSFIDNEDVIRALPKLRLK